MFLDIDGVLLPFGGDDDAEGATRRKVKFPASCVSALAKIVEETSATIVLSSWRVSDAARDEIVSQLRAFGAPFSNFGGFEYMTDPDHSVRSWEMSTGKSPRDVRRRRHSVGSYRR